jgi:hypothetical protein
MKIDKIKSKFSNQTVRSWLKKMPNELEIDAIGLWQIIPAGVHNFGLSGNELEEFTQRAIIAILERGGLPAIGYNSADGGGWKRAIEYGETNSEIVRNIVQKWLYEIGRKPEVDDIWFVKKEKIDIQ